MSKTVEVSPHNDDMSDFEYMKEQGYDLTEEEIAMMEAQKEEEEDEELEEEEEKDEDSSEDEDEEYEEEDDDIEEEDEEDKKDIKIPKWRYDEQVQKEREKYSVLEGQFKAQEERTKWLEEQLGQLIQNQQAPKKDLDVSEPKFNFEEAYEKYADLVASGEDKQAAALMAKIDIEKDKAYEKRLKQLEENLLKKTEENNRKLSQEEKLDLVLQNAASKYPFLNSESDEFDNDIAVDIDAYAQGYAARNKVSLPEAYQRALKRLADPLVNKEQPAKTELKDKKKTQVRKKKKVRKMASQPPETEGSVDAPDTDLDDIDLSSMTDQEWDKLSDKDKKYLIKKFDVPA
jgi:hypothetical protein